MEGTRNFTGEFEHTLDAKGRLIVPSRYRGSLGEKCYLMQGWDKACICILPSEEWEKMVQEYLSHVKLVDESGQDFKRLLASSASECEMDRQGRIFIPENLRKYAGIEAAVTIVGVINRLEIWSTDRWQELKKGTPFLDLARKMEVKFT